jgi:hypothetical protein
MTARIQRSFQRNEQQHDDRRAQPAGFEGFAKKNHAKELSVKQGIGKAQKHGIRSSGMWDYPEDEQTG